MLELEYCCYEIQIIFISFRFLINLHRINLVTPYSFQVVNNLYELCYNQSYHCHLQHDSDWFSYVELMFSHWSRLRLRWINYYSVDDVSDLFIFLEFEIES